ncbi:uncharacterized protein LOC132209556 [Stegostoma tigrinum]|uniref:uncharacterized protein LOC132209556 n=1 Tax=Stegostoma tigrinum TaxID=3053191 RepID=UPI00286FD1DA|nr:uncharacterized protein LOC132209556 [Stegostoma tigrinum]
MQTTAGRHYNLLKETQGKDPPEGADSHSVRSTGIGAETKMLTMFLTVSVLFGHQVAAREKVEVVDNFCEEIDCSEPETAILENGYEEVTFNPTPWLETAVDGKNLNDAVKAGLDRLFKYSHFNNDEETIVPLTPPWGVIGCIEDGKIQNNFKVFVILPPHAKEAPKPTDTLVQIGQKISAPLYLMAFDESDGSNLSSEKYEGRVFQLMKALEADNRPFDKTFFYIGWFNGHGLMEVAFQKKI